MNSNLKRFTVVAALAAATALPQEGTAQAQTGWGNFQIHTGWMNPAPLAESNGVIINGVFVDTDARLGLDEGFGIGAGFDFWFGGSRIWGLSLEGTYNGWKGFNTRFDGLADEFTDDLDFDFGHDVALWQYDASLALRLVKPTANTRWLPWLSVGVGGVSINPDNDPALFGVGACVNPLITGGGPVVCDFPAADVLIDTGSRSEVAFVPGIGLDFFLSPSITLRLEAKDYWTDNSPFFRLSDGIAHNGGHNILLNGGLAFYWGGRRVQEPGFVREEPIYVAPPPPPPPPAEVRSTMCVVDPNGYQVRTIETITVPSDNRVYVTRNGQRVLFETAYPTSAPIYVRNATWYTNDQPLVVDLETGNPMNVPAAQRNRLDLVLFGSPASRSASDMVFIGTINGTPVYANRTDVGPLQSRLGAQLAVSTDLGTIMRADADLARALGAVRTFYVAVEPNCVFQPMSGTLFVRRTRG